MRSITRIGLLAAAALAGAHGTQALAAAAVEVSYVAPETFADFGFAAAESKSNRDALTRHFQQIGARRLADGQTLAIEVLDVDLAGSSRPWRSIAGSEVRVVRPDIDWTRIHVRYTLQGGGQPARSGEEWISGIGQSFDVWRGGSAALGSERRMLDDWFVKRFGKNAAQP